MAGRISERGSEMEIYDAKVNHLKNPLGFFMEKLSFSWKVREARGTRQRAARIRIAADAAFTDILTDTGYQEHADSLGTEVPLALNPHTRYYWTVTVRDDAGGEASSDAQWFETAKRGEAWQGKWITCDSQNPRHPFFEKEIRPAGEVESARLYISGLGLYEAFYNGEKIGNEYLTPYCSNYREWVQYQTYDVTEQLKKSGTLSVLLGNGWYKGRFGFAAREEKGFYGNEWKLIAELHIRYRDGGKEVVGTDDSWRVRRSTLLFSNFYDGEHRDDTLADGEPEAAALCGAPEGVLAERRSIPVTAHETFQASAVLCTPAEEQVLDMGQEFAGIFSLRVHEPKGTKIRIQTGEVLQDGNFYNGNLRTAKSEYIYISNGGETTIIPHFTYYGYRYVKIEGITDLKASDFTGIALYSDVRETGKIETGHAMLNRFFSNVTWGLKSNFLDVPTDCPQRDERMGWTGDAQVFLPTAAFLTDSYAFYAKYLYDLAQEQKAAEGKVPNIIPSFGVTDTSSVWGDAACLMPWNLYLFYGDKSILEAQYDSMKAWVDYIKRTDGDCHAWRGVFHFGDWLALDHPAGGAEQTLGGTDEDFIANIYYAASAALVAKAAGVLGYKEDEAAYGALAGQQFAEVKREYFSAAGRCCVRTQTALLLTLKYHLSDNEALIRKQLEKLLKDCGGMLKTGFVGTPLLCNVLSENGFHALAWKLLLNEEYPGWLHEVKLGATTVWERWNSLTDDGKISGTGMNSLNHYAYGAVAEWMFRWAAGLNFDEAAAGCRSVTIAPQPNWEVRCLRAEYDSPAGTYAVGWEIVDAFHVKIDVRIPFGAQARLILPDGKPAENASAEEDSFSGEASAKRMLKAGSYTMIWETKEPLKTIYSTASPIRTLRENAKVRALLGRVLPLDRIPETYLDRSLRDMAAKFGGRMTEEQLNELDDMLAKL